MNVSKAPESKEPWIIPLPPWSRYPITAIASPPAVMNAVMNAIGTEISMPATAEKVWKASNQNKKKNSEAA